MPAAPESPETSKTEGSRAGLHVARWRMRKRRIGRYRPGCYCFGREEKMRRMRSQRLPGSHGFPAYSGIFMMLAVAAADAFSGFANAAEPVTLAVSDFDFRDTSGEVRDQSAEHAKRLKALGITLQEGLSAVGRLNIVPMTCETGRCTAGTAGLEALSIKARDVGATYLLIGEVRKLSTLVGGVKFAVLDLTSNKPTCDRFLSYRGDTDEAWRRAAAFAAQDIEKHCLPK
ncbi:DUF3280 domain-containing protein [Neorhizobium petrolearium]|uniref:DUF2380 domain-containing protein n=2 Tax=Neorhizobium petrolearium TaxID=515361 RepID=UPI003F161F44